MSIISLTQLDSTNLQQIHKSTTSPQQVEMLYSKSTINRISGV